MKEVTLPQHHVVSPERSDQWVITCCNDAVYEELLVPFLGSLISVARWTGPIAVLDYGLSPSRVERLQALGIEVDPVPLRHFVNLDRFLHLASFTERHPGLLAQWDADVWFTEDINPLFDGYNDRHGDRLICNLDRVFQQSCFWVAREDPQIIERVRAILEPIIQAHGNVLQCGFVAGPSTTVGHFSRYLDELIRTCEYHPEWNSDTVGLNYFFTHHRQSVELIDQRYNCLPDWRPRREGRQFFLDDLQIRVVHVTSPWRAVTDGDFFRFQTVYPKLYQQWLDRLLA